jgi:nucleotide-binding universal stress UspA family protein
MAAAVRTAASPTRPVVVGVDGSPRSAHALRWAAEEAQLRGAEVIAVHACEAPSRIAPYAPVHPSGPGPERLLRDGQTHLADLVLDALGVSGGGAVRQVCEQTSPVRALLAHARGASLLVVAAGGDVAGGAGIGPTALACVRNAGCPVVVLPVEHGG